MSDAVALPAACSSCLTCGPGLLLRMCYMVGRCLQGAWSTTHQGLEHVQASCVRATHACWALQGSSTRTAHCISSVHPGISAICTLQCGMCQAELTLHVSLDRHDDHWRLSLLSDSKPGFMKARGFCPHPPTSCCQRQYCFIHSANQPVPTNQFLVNMPSLQWSCLKHYACQISTCMPVTTVHVMLHLRWLLCIRCQQASKILIER